MRRLDSRLVLAAVGWAFVPTMHGATPVATVSDTRDRSMVQAGPHRPTPPPPALDGYEEGAGRRPSSAARPSVPRSSEERQYGPDGDGVAGWREPEGPDVWTSCVPTPPIDTSIRETPKDLSFSIEVAGTKYAVWQSITAKVYVTNLSSKPVLFDTRAFGTLIDGTGRGVTDVYRTGDDAEGWEREIRPYEYVTYGVEVTPSRCGDTSSDDSYAPAGMFGLVAVLDWTAQGGEERGRWVSPAQPVERDFFTDLRSDRPWGFDAWPDWHVLEPAVDAPCRTDGSNCEQPTIDRGRSCSTAMPPNADFGLSRGLRLIFEPDAARPSSDVLLHSMSGEFTVTNDGADVAWLTVYDFLDAGWLSPSGTSTHLSGRRDLDISEHRYRIEPGGFAKIGAPISTTTCDGTPLPPGVYTATAGIYVAGHGWWFAPDTFVVLTT